MQNKTPPESKINPDSKLKKDSSIGKPGAGGVITLAIREKSALYAAYMPFVKNGGMFIPTNKNYKYGDEVFLLLTLMDEKEKIPVAGRIIWITPKGAQGSRPAGIGIQFSDQDGGAVRNKIETYLAGALKSDRQTHTM
jgi:type IV pilus assembly protein PilZ